jgi:hypothetical protein
MLNVMYFGLLLLGNIYGRIFDEVAECGWHGKGRLNKTKQKKTLLLLADAGKASLWFGHSAMREEAGAGGRSIHLVGDIVFRRWRLMKCRTHHFSFHFLQYFSTSPGAS